MLLDLLFAFPLIILALLGFRDGIVRKLVAIAVIIAAMFIAQVFMKDVGDLLVEYLSTDKNIASMNAYFAIFFSLILLQSLLYRVLAGGYKIGGIADRILGCALGIFEGALILSVVLVMFSLRGVPERKTARDSRMYKPLVSIAPMITDFATTAVPEAKESLEKITTPDKKEPSSVRSMKAEQENVQSSTKGIDSLQKAAKKQR